MMNGDLLGTMGWDMVVWTIILVGLTALVAVMVVCELLGVNRRRSRAEDQSKEVLRRRLAQGEISTEEYNSLRRQLR